ncbi:metal-dependent transcriptional regulator [Lachnospiraceae bacterium ZAX-1]
MYESGENYLETILLMQRKTPNIRSIDLARELDYSKPSISRAVRILKENGFIKIDGDGYIEFTELGKHKAEAIYERHEILTEFLQEIANVSAEIAEEDACKIEHILRDETFQGIKAYLNK